MHATIHSTKDMAWIKLPITANASSDSTRKQKKESLIFQLSESFLLCLYKGCSSN